jgi:hypothetical protein
MFQVAASASSYASGLQVQIFNQYHNESISFFSTASLLYTDTTSDLTNITTATNSYSLPNGSSYFSTMHYGLFLANATGTWTFYINSDDGSYVWIGPTADSGYTTTNATINDGGGHGPTLKSATYPMDSGTYYPIRIMYGQNSGGIALEFSFTSPSSGTRIYNGTGYYFNRRPFAFTFTTMGTQGATGPPSTATYATPPQGGFSITNGIQYWTVPTTAYYTFIAAGAGSKNWTSYTGGRGIVVSTRVSLNSGNVIKILVGQQGTNTTSYTSGGYAGYGPGGGTFIYNNSTSSIILIAGGGGNAFYVSGPGGDAVATTTASNGTAGGQGGSGGNGCGNTSADHNGGAGFNSGSAGNAHGDSWTAVAQSFMNGGTGATYGGQPVGGFGGGGSIGGGGGYSGGGCINWGASGWGGGGGSYDINSNGGASNNALVYTTLVNGVSGGYNTGSGFVVVTLS